MNIYCRNIRADSLAEWLSIATDGLCESSKARITLEIEAHHDETVSELLAEGKTRPEAERLALEQLGDVMVAKKDFRKRHLTEREEKILSGVLKDIGTKWMVIGYISLFGSIAWLLWSIKLSRSGYWYLASALLLGVFLPLAVIHRLKKRSRTVSNIAKILVVEFIGLVTFMTFLIIACGNYSVEAFIPTLLPPGFRYYKIWRKIRGARDDEFTRYGSP